MAALFKSMCAALIAAVLVAAVAPPTEATISCSTVVSNLLPCLSYVRDRAPLADGCCAGVHNLYKVATTTPNRQDICHCLKNLASSNAGVNLGKAAELPKACSLNIPYKIDPSTDCKSVK